MNWIHEFWVVQKQQFLVCFPLKNWNINCINQKTQNSICREINRHLHLNQTYPPGRTGVKNHLKRRFSPSTAQKNHSISVFNCFMYEICEEEHEKSEIFPMKSVCSNLFPEHFLCNMMISIATGLSWLVRTFMSDGQMNKSKSWVLNAALIHVFISTVDQTKAEYKKGAF